MADTTCTARLAWTRARGSQWIGTISASHNGCVNPSTGAPHRAQFSPWPSTRLRA